MKKQLLIGLVILVMVASMVSAITLTQNQLGSKTDQEIKNYLLDNLVLNKTVIDHDDQRLYLYYTSQIIEPQGNNYVLKEIKVRTVLPFKDIQYCFSLYNNAQCKQGLIYNFGTYWNGDYTDINEDGIAQEEEKQYSDTVYEQLKNKLTANYNQIIIYRDEAQDTTSSDLTSGINTNPAVTI